MTNTNGRLWRLAGWICVQPANLVFEMLCPQIGTNLRKSFIVPTLVGTRTDIIIFVPVMVVGLYKSQDGEWIRLRKNQRVAVGRLDFSIAPWAVHHYLSSLAL